MARGQRDNAEIDGAGETRLSVAWSEWPKVTKGSVVLRK